MTTTTILNPPTTTTTTTTKAPATSAAQAALDAPIPFARLLRVEWGKATDTRAARWLLALTGLATVLIMLAPLLATHSIHQTYTSYLMFPALTLSTLLPVVAIMTMTSEWSQRTVLTTFTQEPRRGRVIRAKVAVSAAMTGIAAVFGVVVTAAALALDAGMGRHVDNDLHASVLLGFVLFLLLNIMMGVAFGALLHNTAASIVLFFILPTAFGILGAAVNSVGQWLDPSKTFGWVQAGHWSGHGAQIAVSILVWVALPLAAGLTRTARREIK